MEALQQKPNEGFTDYYLRWMQKANLVKERPAESDMISRLVAGALPAYKKEMRYKNFTTFKDVNSVGLKVEQGLREEKTNAPSSGGYRGGRASGGFAQGNSSSSAPKTNTVCAT